MARRPTKLEVYDHHVVCPYCHAAVVIRSLMGQLFIASRDCPVCKREMLIKDGRAVKDRAGEARKPKHIRSHLSKEKN